MSDPFALPYPVLPHELSRYAFLFDIDGTLSGLRPTPGEVQINDTVTRFLAFLSQRRIPFALISGRSILDIDTLFLSHDVPCAGVHGAEIRYADGKYERLAICGSDVAHVWERLKLACMRYPALRLENKLISFAIHFRDAPELAAVAMWTAASLAELYPDTFAVQHGKFVCELRPVKASKGAAVEKMMMSPAFCGRTPVYVGDDITDETAFRAVNEMEGFSVKVGDEETSATHRLKDVCGVHRWLDDLMASAAAGCRVPAQGADKRSS